MTRRGHDDRDERRAERRAARRADLLDAAVAAIRQRGANVSMEELAAAAGVSKPILYRHFGDRRGLVTALADRFANELLSHVRVALTQPGDPRDVLVRTIEAFVTIIERDPHIYRFLVQRIAGDQPQAVAQLNEFLRRVGQEVAIVLGEQLRAAGSDSGGAEPLAHGLVGFVYAAGDWWADHRTMPRERLVDYLATLLWSGLQQMLVRPTIP